MTFEHPLPWWALPLVIGGAGAVAWFAYRHAPLAAGRRMVLVAVRFCTLLLLVLLLMRPVVRSGADRAADAIVPILVDTSRSMSIEDAGGMRRIDRAREIVAGRLLPALSPAFQTEVLAFGEALAPANPDALHASGRRSDLAGAVRSVRERYPGRAIAGIVLISDGGDTGGTIEREPPATAAPVFAIGVGAPRVERDREVLGVTAAEAVLDDSRVELAVSAVSHGHSAAPIELRLLENGRPIDVRRSIPAADGMPIREVFHLTPGKGAASVYTVEIPASDGELVPENNSRSVIVQPPARPRRVLLVQGAPGFEHSFLRRAWNGDTGLEVDSVVRKGKNEQGTDTFYIQAAAARSAALAPGYPSTRDALFAYDAIVLANMEGAVLTRAQLEATRDFVARRGGGLLVLGAQSFLRRGLLDTPLEELLPLDLGERGGGVVAAVEAPRGANRVALTTAGESHPIMQLTDRLEETRKRWDAVPALASVSPLGSPRPGATVLAIAGSPGGAPRALVAVQRFGEGRTMAFTGEAAWRWRMLLPASDRSYDTFWRQAVRWLALPAADPVSVQAPAGAAPGDQLTFRVQARSPAFEALRDTTVEIRVTRPDGRIDTIAGTAEPAAPEDGTFVARYQADQPGVHRVAADVRQRDGRTIGSTTSLLVGGADAEMADPRLNLRVLQRLAAASGGRVIDPQQASALAGDLRAALPAAARMARTDLWHNAWSFTIVVSLLAAEWLLRRRWGMR